MDNKQLLNRFLEYVKIDTQSDPNSTSIPTTEKQKDLGKLLMKQLKDLGLEPYQDKYGYISVLLKSNSNKKLAPIGFLSHMDTAPDYNGKNVKPQIIENYQGKKIEFKDGTGYGPKEFTSLNDYKNKTIIATDGTSLLGADDKAGISIIMEMLKYFIDNPDVKHGDVYVAFTLDEEVGTGVDNFELKHFKPDFAYTVDGGPLGELNYETFNAAALEIEFKGLNVHPGSAKNVMRNAMEYANEFHNALPKLDKPEYTENYEGFYMLMNIQGSVESTKAHYIIRDHNKDLFEYRKDYLERLIAEMKKQHPDMEVEYSIKDQYYNMKEPVVEKFEAVEYAKAAMKKNDVKPLIQPIRGGTDGSKLSFRGIPCPNIFTGGHNFHGKFEFVCLESMGKARDIIIDIVKSIDK